MAPTITFTTAASYTYGQSFQLAATFNSSGTFTYSLVSGPATVSAAGAVTVTGEGTVTVRASEAAASGYTAGTKQTSFNGVTASTMTKLIATAVKSGNGSAAKLTATVTPQFSNASMPFAYHVSNNSSLQGSFDRKTCPQASKCHDVEASTKLEGHSSGS